MIGEFIETTDGMTISAGASVKGYDFSAIKNVIPYKASIIARNNEVCTLEGKIERSNFETTVNFSDEKYIIKSYGQSNTIDKYKTIANTIGTMINEKSVVAGIKTMLPIICDANGKEIGKVDVLLAGEEFQGYQYEKYTINNVVLYAYQIAHAFTDILYCIYNEQNQMVATISKKRVVSNGLARYTLYVCNDEWFKYIALVAACWAIKFQDEDGGPGATVIKNESTIQAELMEKYNPSFIEQVKKKEGVNNLPENMSLVTAKTQAGKNSFGVLFNKIIVFIVFGFFIALFIYMFLIKGVK